MPNLSRRDTSGRWMAGISGNPEGRLPRQTETKYLEVTMRECTPDEWAEIIHLAVEDAKDMEASPHVRARAREWLAKYVIGEPSQLHQLLYKEERTFEIIVRFGDNGSKALPDVVDVEPVVIDAD